MKVLITEQQLKSILSEQSPTSGNVRTDDKTKNTNNKNIVGKDNMYNRLVKAFGSKVVGKFKKPDSYSFKLPNKTFVYVLYSSTDGSWVFYCYPEENVYPNITDGEYFYSEGEIELIGDLDFKITLYNNEGTYDSQTKKWNGSSDVLPLPKREDPKSLIQSNDIFKRSFKFYGKKMVIGSLSYKDRIEYYAQVYNNDTNYLYFYNSGYVKWTKDDENFITGQFIPMDNDDFQLKFQNGSIFDSKTKKWTKGKPFEIYEIEGKNMSEFTSNIIKETKNIKINLNSVKIDMDNFNLSFHVSEGGTQIYGLYLSLDSTKNPYNKPESILNNFPNSKIIGRGNFPNKPENNYTLIAIII